MTRTAVFGLSAGILFVVATLIAVATLSFPPRQAGAAVVDGSLVACPLAVVSLDQGYGVSRRALVPVCGSDGSVSGKTAAR